MCQHGPFPFPINRSTPSRCIYRSHSFIEHALPDPPALSPVALRDPKDTATLARRLRDGWDKVLSHVAPDPSSTRDYSVYTGACVRSSSPRRAFSFSLIDTHPVQIETTRPRRHRPLGAAHGDRPPAPPRMPSVLPQPPSHGHPFAAAPLGRGGRGRAVGPLARPGALPRPGRTLLDGGGGSIGPLRAAGPPAGCDLRHGRAGWVQV